MMEAMLAHAERIARDRQSQAVDRMAEQLRARFGARAVSVGAGEVSVRARGLLKRWLSEPGLRFLAGEIG